VTTVVLGMHRSGTSCLARMLSAGAEGTIRNWDNARGHFERLDLVRLDDAVLAHSGGHWLAAPERLRWTAAHAAARDELLATGAVLKDPRMLLTLPFWRASPVPFRAIGIIRHPLAVARSLEAWRGTPVADGIALWTAHVRALSADRAAYGTPILDFDQPRGAFIAAVHAVVPDADAAAYEADLVHHDASDSSVVAGLEEALALHASLVGRSPPASTRFPRAHVDAFLLDLDPVHARLAIEAVADPAAVLVPLVNALVRRRELQAASALLDEHASRIEPALGDLLRGKLALARGDASSAVVHLERASAATQPYFQARSLLPHALRASGRHADARAALRGLAAVALYAHVPLATLAEWAFLDGERDPALATMREASDAAPLHRTGRLRTRLADWLLARGDRSSARHELELAVAEDPGYARSAEVLASLL